jgi:hypothetical protein
VFYDLLFVVFYWVRLLVGMLNIRHGVSEAKCWLNGRLWTFEVMYPEETEINLIKFRLTDVFISWYHMRSDEFLTALSGGLNAFGNELFCVWC